MQQDNGSRIRRKKYPFRGCSIMHFEVLMLNCGQQAHSTWQTGHKNYHNYIITILCELLNVIFNKKSQCDPSTFQFMCVQRDTNKLLFTVAFSYSFVCSIWLLYPLFLFESFTFEWCYIENNEFPFSFALSYALVHFSVEQFHSREMPLVLRLYGAWMIAFIQKVTSNSLSLCKWKCEYVNDALVNGFRKLCSYNFIRWPFAWCVMVI